MSKSIEKLNCDGVPRYRVLRKNNLTYSEAWAEIAAKFPAHSPNVPQRYCAQVSPSGFRLLKTLNRTHKEHTRKTFNQ